jgi:integrase
MAEKTAKRAADTVAELCDRYLKDLEAGHVLTKSGRPKKASTTVTDRGRITRHIKPLLGALKVSAVTPADVKQFMQDIANGKTKARVKTERKRGLANVRGGRGTASRTLGLLGGIFSYGGVTPNPVHGVTRYKDGERTRRLSPDEYKALATGLTKAEAEGIWPPAIAAIRFLIFTGWRSGEVADLRRQDLKLAERTAVLGDTKTYLSIRPLSKRACAVLKRVLLSGEFVFPPSRGAEGSMDIGYFWAEIAKLGELPDDITPHTLRHSFASLAGDLGYSELMIAGLIGHRKASVTSKYIHLADPLLLAAADAVSNRTEELMGVLRPGAQVISMRRKA